MDVSIQFAMQVMIALMMLLYAVGVCLRLCLFGAASAAARMSRTRLRCAAAHVVAAAAAAAAADVVAAAAAAAAAVVVVSSNHQLRGDLW